MSFYHCVTDSIELLFFGLIYSILMIYSDNRLVSRNLDNIKSVNITELSFLSKSSTSHTALLLELVKEVLESNSSKSLGLSLNLNMLLGFNSLVETI